MEMNRGVTVKTTLLIVLVVVFAISALGACDLVKEGVTGEKQDMASGDSSGSAEAPQALRSAAFDIVGDWFGVYAEKELLTIKFSEDGKCELQPAVYASDMLGPRYYGEYTWGGANGREISLDLYKGIPSEPDEEGGSGGNEWSDGGRNNSATALNMSFAVYGCEMQSFALQATTAGVDTDGYTVVKGGAFFITFPGTAGDPASGFFFGTEPADQTEGKVKTSIAPSVFSADAERFFTTDDLNIRCGPDVDNASYGMATKGTAVYKIGGTGAENEEWAFVLLDGGGGWCSTEYLSETAPAEE